MLALRPWTRTELLPRPETLFGLVPEEFGNVFNRFFSWPMMEVPERGYPWGMTMEERENETVVRVELPGFAPEEVTVELVEERLTVVAEHKAPAEKEGEGTRPEREYARVRRELTLPAGVVPEKVEATLRNGILEVHLPRTPEATPRRIAVTT